MSDCCYTPELLPVAEAQAALLNAATPISETESVGLYQAYGRVLAESISSNINVPGHDNSAMDGYAVRRADISGDGPTRLAVAQRIPAGAVGETLVPGTCARIFTGAPIPEGADAVVMQEVVDDQGDFAVFNEEPGLGDHIRPAGNDIKAGDQVLAAGCKLEPQHIGLLASLGTAEVKVYRRLRVGIFFTGDELVEPGESLRPGSIYNSNAYTLQGLLENFGCEVENLGLVPDSFDATCEALDRASANNDIVMTSGGVSVGEEDHVKGAVESRGHIDLWRIAIKPGKPFAWGKANDAVFMGLPGNPVSVFATFMIMSRPFLLRMQGRTDVLPIPLPVPADFEWPRERPRREFARAQLVPIKGGGLGVSLHARQGSDVLSSVVWSDGLVEIPEGETVAPGDAVNFYSLADLLR